MQWPSSCFFTHNHQSSHFIIQVTFFEVDFWIMSRHEYIEMCTVYTYFLYETFVNVGSVLHSRDLRLLSIPVDDRWVLRYRIKLVEEPQSKNLPKRCPKLSRHGTVKDEVNPWVCKGQDIHYVTWNEKRNLLVTWYSGSISNNDTIWMFVK